VAFNHDICYHSVIFCLIRSNKLINLSRYLSTHKYKKIHSIFPAHKIGFCVCEYLKHTRYHTANIPTYTSLHHTANIPTYTSLHHTANIPTYTSLHTTPQIYPHTHRCTTPQIQTHTHTHTHTHTQTVTKKMKYFILILCLFDFPLSTNSSAPLESASSRRRDVKKADH